MTDNLSADLASLRIERSEPPSTRVWLKVLLWLGIVGAAAATYVVAAPYVESKLFKTAVAVTEITLVSPAQASVQLTATGYVQADLISRMAPKVPGRVSQVHVRQGDQVQAGQVLLTLDPSDEKAGITAALSEAAAARAQAQSAKARADVARAQLAEAQLQASRARTLADQGVSPNADAEDLEARVDSLAQAVDAAIAEAGAAAANAQALQARAGVFKTALNNLTLTSPITGTILNKPPQIGEYVGPQPPGVVVDMGGIRVADLGSLVVEADVPEGRLALVKPEAPVEIVLDAYPSKRFRGEVKQITPMVDRAKATVIVKVAFVDSADGVLPDMSARVSFLDEPIEEKALEQPPKLVVPGSAIAERAGSKVVFVVDRGKARMVPVQLGAPFGGGFELLQGPRAGTQVVSEPPPELADGQSVKVQG